MSRSARNFAVPSPRSARTDDRARVSAARTTSNSRLPTMVQTKQSQTSTVDQTSELPSRRSVSSVTSSGRALGNRPTLTGRASVSSITSSKSSPVEHSAEGPAQSTSVYAALKPFADLETFSSNIPPPGIRRHSVSQSALTVSSTAPATSTSVGLGKTQQDAALKAKERLAARSQSASLMRRTPSFSPQPSRFDVSLQLPPRDLVRQSSSCNSVSDLDSGRFSDETNGSDLVPEFPVKVVVICSSVTIYKSVDMAVSNGILNNGQEVTALEDAMDVEGNALLLLKGSHNCKGGWAIFKPANGQSNFQVIRGRSRLPSVSSVTSSPRSVPVSPHSVQVSPSLRSHTLRAAHSLSTLNLGGPQLPLRGLTLSQVKLESILHAVAIRKLAGLWSTWRVSFILAQWRESESAWQRLSSSSDVVAEKGPETSRSERRKIWKIWDRN